MSIEHTILGLLSWRPSTGYDLKKMFAGSLMLHWSGNNNQIYRTLLDLQKRGLVTYEVQEHQRGPARKLYTITDAGRAALKAWLGSEPELPQLRQPFLLQLAWADEASLDEIDAVLARYEEQVHVQLLALRARAGQEGDASAVHIEDAYLNCALARTPRESYLWDMIAENWIAFYEREYYWVRRLRAGLGDQ